MWTMEQPMQAWNDTEGSRFEVGPDRDGLDLVEIRDIDAVGRVVARITMPKEAWEIVRKYNTGVVVDE